MNSEAERAFRPVAPIPRTRPVSTLRFLLDLSRNPIAAFGAYAYRAPLIYRRSAIRHFLMVNDPAGVRHILVDNAANYPKSGESQKMVRPVVGNGLLTAEGESWRFQRRTAAPMFQPRHITSFAPAMAAATEDMLARWDRLGPDAVVDVLAEMMRLAFDIISRSVFSGDVTIDPEQMARALTTYLDTRGRIDVLDILGLPPWMPTPSRLRAAPALSFIRRELDALIAKRRARLQADPASVPGDLLTLLLTAHDPEEGALFSAAQVYDNVATFILAGHETTANALSWAFYLLSQFPSYDTQLAAEACAVLQGRCAGADDLAELSFTRAVLDETMRLYPPAPLISRDAREKDIVCGTAIEAGTAVLISPFVLHRHQALWDAPDQFRPERFALGAREQIPRFAYIPFGAGPRICIGMAFAMQEAMIALSRIVQRYRLELSPGYRVEPLARITLRPRHGLKMRLVQRR